jgi:hypothetical protein
MVGHYDSGKQMDSFSVLPQTVVQDKIARLVRQDQRAACTKCYEERCVKFVKVGKAAAILIFLLDGPFCFVAVQLQQFVWFLSVTDEHRERTLGCRGTPSRGRGRPHHTS